MNSDSTLVHNIVPILKKELGGNQRVWHSQSRCSGIPSTMILPVAVLISKKKSGQIFHCRCCGGSDELGFHCVKDCLTLPPILCKVEHFSLVSFVLRDAFSCGYFTLWGAFLCAELLKINRAVLCLVCTLELPELEFVLFCFVF